MNGDEASVPGNHDPDSDPGLARSVLAYYLFQATAGFGFLIPVWVVLLKDRGLSLTAITLLDSAFFATLVLAEVPTGYVVDRLGRRRALALGSFGRIRSRGLALFFGANAVTAVVGGCSMPAIPSIRSSRRGDAGRQRCRRAGVPTGRRG